MSLNKDIWDGPKYLNPLVELISWKDFKFFLTADLDVRSIRRKNELKKLGEDLSIDEIKASMRRRDHIDSSREFSPLKRSEDSIEYHLLYNSDKKYEVKIT